MSRVGTVVEVCVSSEKGTPKTPIGRVRLVENHGVEGDVIRTMAAGKCRLPEIGRAEHDLWDHRISSCSPRATSRIQCSGPSGEPMVS